MKPRFVQHPKHSEQLARHAWRFYFLRPDATVRDMSQPSYAAWSACNSVYNAMDETDKQIVKVFHATMDPPSLIAEHMGLTLDRVMNTVRRSWRCWSVQRGVADDIVGRATEQVLDEAIKQTEADNNTRNGDAFTVCDVNRTDAQTRVDADRKKEGDAHA